MIFIREITLSYGHKKLFNEISETIGPRERIALVGSNGSGKTTLINCISGAFTDYAGDIHFNGQDISCFGESDGEITGAVTSGAAPFEYSLDNGATWQVLETIIGTDDGLWIPKQ